jgi:hypothetical protein
VGGGERHLCQRVSYSNVHEVMAISRQLVGACASVCARCMFLDAKARSVISSWQNMGRDPGISRGGAAVATIRFEMDGSRACSNAMMACNDASKRAIYAAMGA